MKLNKYQRLAIKTGDNVKLNEYQSGARSTAIYPGKLMYPTLGLCGEAGELVAAYNGRPGDAVKEAGDCLWYVANVAADAGLTLEEICERKSFRIKPFNCWDSFKALTELTIQCGIVAENVKKTVRDTDGVLTDVRRENIREALQVIMSCLAAVLHAERISFGKCAKMNLEKLYSRQERGKLSGDGDNR